MKQRTMAQNAYIDEETEKVQFSELQNIKCSIEIKNGIPQRSLNNFHKNQNALVLNNYTVSICHWKIIQPLSSIFCGRA